MNTQKARFDPTTSRSESFRKLNPELFPSPALDPGIVAKFRPKPGATPTLRQPHRKTSEIEAAFGIELRREFPDGRIYEQWPIPIGSGCNYYVDFLVVTGTPAFGFRLRAFEVKGWRREAGQVKLKVAARLFPWIVFFFVTRSPAGWNRRIVSP